MNTSVTSSLEVESLPRFDALSSSQGHTSPSLNSASMLHMISAMRSVTDLVNETTVGPSTLVVPVSRSTYDFLAVYTGLLTIFGILNNGIVIVLFFRYSSLRIPINSFLFNVSLSDLIVSCLASPFTFASNVAGRWLYGDLGCTLYAFLVMVAGCEQIVILALVSMHRCLLVVRPFTAQKLTHSMAAALICLTWLYSLVMCLPPFFGWSSFTYEGPGTACGIAWNSKKPGDSAYIVFIFIGILAIPLFLIIASYALLIYAVAKISSTAAARSSDAKTERKVTKMVLLMVGCFLVAWSPYAGFSLYVSFGTNPKVGPIAGVLPSFFAKLCTVYNPIIYFLMNKQFKDALIDMIFCGENPFDREDSGEGRQGQRGNRAGGEATNRGRGRRISASVPTVSSRADIPQSCGEAGDAAEDGDNTGCQSASGTVFELSSKVQSVKRCEVGAPDRSTTLSTTAASKVSKRASNKVESLPPVD
ncbi:pinopsin-like [Diadema antillarum]|uniref:pinopsin-like n=1 Tax=Diadema antillarum TaxID=105358 RepID=UPI003A83F231